MSELRVTELDFSGIKQNLRRFLQSQSEFSDYNFEGSALSVLIDLLAYNTHYNGVLAHLVANEMFLDSAVKRSSVLSIAKLLGYVPRSTTSARIRATVVVGGGASPTLTLGTDDIFTGTIDNANYRFSPIQDYTVPLSGGVYTFTDVELIEGRRLTNTFTVTADTVSGPFVLPVESIDIETLAVYVRESSTNSAYEVFRRVDTIAGLDANSSVYWIEERGDGTYQIYFGDNIFGKSLSVGNVITVEYLASSGPVANGIRLLQGSRIGGQSIVSITTTNMSAGGSVKESTESIRKTAPIFNAAKNRVVTSQDYVALIKRAFDKAKGVVVWGGEQNDPPIYGKVFITIDPVDGYVLTDIDRDFIIERVLRPASVMSIQHEFVDPRYLHIGFRIEVTYDPIKTNFNASQIASSVDANIRDYFGDELSTLERPFFYSRLNEIIDQTSPAIIGSDAKMTLQARFVPELGRMYSGSFDFLTVLEPERISSSTFVCAVNGLNYTAYLQDYADSDIRGNAVTGTMKIVNVATNQPVATIGTVNYSTGKVTLNALDVVQFVQGSGDIRITAEPSNLHKNITTTITRTTDVSDNAIVPLAAKNTILVLDDSSANSALRLSTGLVVTATPYTNR